LTGKIGPHEGIELELLLKGEKPLARFTLDGLESEYEAKFELAVARGDIFGVQLSKHARSPSRSPILLSAWGRMARQNP
jgi:hypothetical protein